MKKKVMTAIITIMCCTFCIMPFSVVKAMVANNYSGNIAKGNTIIGRFVSYILEPDPGETYLSSYVFTDHSFNYQSGSVSYVNFNSYCNGTIRFDITDLNKNTAVWVESDSIGSWTTDYTNGYIDITLVNTNNFRVYTMSTNANVNSYIVGYNATSVEIIEEVDDNYLTYQIPDDRIMAFNFFLNLGDYIHYDTYSNYPSINISTTKSTTIYVHGDEEIIIAYFTNDIQTADRTVKGLFNITRSGVGPWSLTETQLVDYNQYRVGTGYFIAAKLKVSVSIPATSYVTLTFTPKYDRTIKPIYFGLSNNYMSEETMGLLGLTDLPPDNTQDMTDMAGELGDLNDEEHDILSGFETDLTDFNTDMDLDDYDFITNLTDSNTYFKMVLNDVFTNSSSVRAFWVIPLILVIITALLGR